MHLRTWLAACVLIGVTLPAAASEVLVAAAASLTNAFGDLATQYEAAHPGIRVLTTFGASDVVLRQILEGAPADVYASADEQAMDKAVAAHAVDPASRVNFARNRVVLIVPNDNPAHIHTLADLRQRQVTRVALGNPASVPVGRYTQAALRQAGLWQAVQAREILGQNVRQVLSYVERGEVDAGFVFATDAALMPHRVLVVQTLDSPVPVIYPAAFVSRKDRAPEASGFLHFLTSPAGEAVLARYGFTRP